MPPVVPRSLAALALCSACVLPEQFVGELRDDAAAATSGERLRMRWYVAEGGAQVFAGIVDTATQAPCRFGLAPDGRMRCLPFVQHVYYRNSDCTAPVAIEPVDDACGVPEYHGEFVTSGCDETPTAWIYRSTDDEIPPGPRFARGLGGACEAVEVDGRARGLEVVDPSTFVAASWVEEPRPGGLTVRRLEAEDGSRFIAELVDTWADRSCSPGLAGGRLRCLPLRIADTFGFGTLSFADAECNAPAGTPAWFDACPPDLVHDLGDYYLPGGRVEQWWYEDEGTCSPSDAFGGAYRLGAPVAVESFPPLESRLSGEGRIGASNPIDAGRRSVWPYGQLYDNETLLDCEIVTDRTGTLRCLPSELDGFWSWPPSFFADENCTVPLLASDQFGIDVPYVPVMAAGECGGFFIEALYEVLGPFEGESTWLRFSDGSCTAVTTPSDLYNLREVDPSVLAPLFEVLD